MSGVPTLSHDPLRLRSLQPSDIGDRLRCGRNVEFVHMCGGNSDEVEPMTEEQARRWYQQLSQESYVWALDISGRCIGHARLHSLDEHDRRVRCAVGIYDPSCWGQGMGTLATRLVLGYAFDVLGLHRVDLRVLDYNTRAIACYRRCGFQIEGRERQSAWVDGNWHDDLMMSILADEYRDQPWARR